VLLHGLGSCADDWPLQRGALEGRWPVLALDLRGHGRSTPARRPFSVGDMAADVAGVLDHLGCQPAHLVGLSLGAVVGLELALGRPDRVRSLTMTNGFAHLAIPPEGLASAAGRLLLYFTGRMDWLGRWIAKALFPRPDQEFLRRQAADRIAADDWLSYGLTMWALRKYDARPRLDGVTTPTLVIAGEQDPVVPRSAKEQLRASIAGARLVTIPGSGHASPLDAPQEFNRILVQFLESVDAGDE
jgi:3-oxoadipate enol-lactonase